MNLEKIVLRNDRQKFLKAPSAASRASPLASDQQESSPTSHPESPCTKDHVPPLRPASSASLNKRKKEKSTGDAKSEQMKNASPSESPTNLTVQKSSAGDRSTGLSPSPVHYDAYSTIDHVIRELNIYTLSFRYPDDLDFEAPPPNSELVPKLAYTAKNRSFLEQVSKLESLQEKLDGINSHGDKDVRQARKETGALVERALAYMEWAKAVVWDKASTILKILGYRIVSDHNHLLFQYNEVSSSQLLCNQRLSDQYK